MATIRIDNLKLRAIIGIYGWEREHKQDVIINVKMDFDASKSIKSDSIEDTVDYKVITKRIIKEVEASDFQLLEKLTQMILSIVMDNSQVQEATVRVDKPFALRFADSVSIELTEKTLMMNHVIIGLGSNIKPDQNIQQARNTLSQQYRVVAESTFKVTKPVGKIKQADFINGSVLIETDLPIDTLKSELEEVEKGMGRNRPHDRYGPRTIDLDIVVWNSDIIDQDFYERDYLKEAVLELIPQPQTSIRKNSCLHI